MKSRTILRLPLFLVLWMATASSGAAAPFAYIGNHLTNTVAVVDLATNSVVASVPIAAAFNDVKIAIRPDGAVAYATGGYSNAVTAIDTKTNTVIAVIPVGVYSFDITVTPDGSKLYVSNMVSATISVISTATNTVVATIPVSRDPAGLATSPDGTSLYVTHGSSSDSGITIISTASDRIVGTIPLGQQCVFGIEVLPTGTRAYTANYCDRSLSVIDLVLNIELVRVPFDGYPYDLAASPDSSEIYVLNFLVPGHVRVFSTETNVQVASIQVGNIPYGLAFTPDGTSVYVTNFGDSTVSIIDTSAKEVVEVLSSPLFDHPAGIAITPSETPSKKIGALIALVNSFQLGHGLSASLEAKLMSAINALLTERANSLPACKVLLAFDNQVRAHAGKAISTSQVTQLLSASADIRNTIGCR